ncbi:thiamine-monophosphate kinase [Comamonas phosphati]|nr:thiamine-monophosphate kinase [Comamonas phosphati]
MGEFDLIRRFFQRPVRRAVLGVGDDCALLAPQPGMQLAISSDMLVEGRHFFADVDPAALGHKALAVNLSDLAACGARPLAFTLALALPQADEAWVGGFAQGLLALADAHDCELIGGDTTQGPLNICITVFGEVPAGQALLRSGARAGDDIYVSGTLGDARLALEAMLGHVALPLDALQAARQRLERPTPRVALGLALRGIASSALDVSDGLTGDLGHILQASGVGATLDAQITSQLIAAHALFTVDTAILIPSTPDSSHQPQPLEPMQTGSGTPSKGRPAAMASSPFQGEAAQRLRGLLYQCTLAGGDDYELAFTAPASHRQAVQEAALHAGVPVTRIGTVDSTPGLRVVDGSGQPLAARYASFDHFGSI